MQRRAHAGDLTLDDRPVMRAGQLDSHRNLVRQAPQPAGDRAEALGQHRIRPAVQQAEILAIVRDRHGPHDPLRIPFGDLDAHPFDQLFPGPAGKHLTGARIDFKRDSGRGHAEPP